MARLNWGASGERFYENGLDRGVFYPPTGPGVAWPGLISVSESPTGGEARPYFYDGFKYLNLSAKEEFNATIVSFGEPEGFGPCVGSVDLAPGLSAGNQPKKSFGFTYRTLLTNDLGEQDYKIHIVYNALASAAAKNRRTTGSAAEPLQLSWTISTRPPAATGFRPTAHLIVSSKDADPTALQALEDLLYGDDNADAGLPSIEDLITTLQV